MPVSGKSEEFGKEIMLGGRKIQIILNVYFRFGNIFEWKQSRVNRLSTFNISPTNGKGRIWTPLKTSRCYTFHVPSPHRKHISATTHFYLQRPPCSKYKCPPSCSVLLPFCFWFLLSVFFSLAFRSFSRSSSFLFTALVSWWTPSRRAFLPSVPRNYFYPHLRHGKHFVNWCLLQLTFYNWPVTTDLLQLTCFTTDLLQLFFHSVSVYSSESIVTSIAVLTFNEKCTMKKRDTQ